MKSSLLLSVARTSVGHGLRHVVELGRGSLMSLVTVAKKAVGHFGMPFLNVTNTFMVTVIFGRLIKKSSPKKRISWHR